jgi:hypothetical protein
MFPYTFVLILLQVLVVLLVVVLVALVASSTSGGSGTSSCTGTTTGSTTGTTTGSCGSTTGSSTLGLLVLESDIAMFRSGYDMSRFSMGKGLVATTAADLYQHGFYIVC